MFGVSATAVSTSRSRSSIRKFTDRDAEVLRRHVLELVRLVDDQRCARRDDFAVVALAKLRVCTEQVVVHDDDIGLAARWRMSVTKQSP